jgi:hypothetical protein
MAIDPAPAVLPAGLSAHAFSSLFQAVAGLRNRRAIVALLGCLFLGIMIVGLLTILSMQVGGFAMALAALVWIVALGTGVNAAGLLQMDHARGISPRSTVDALVYGLLCIPKLLALGLIFFAAVLAVFLAIAILLLICRIPVLGPMLFVVVFPVSVVAAGVTIFAAVLCTLLSAPAVWQGASITRALAQTLAIARSRLVDAVLLLAFLGFIAMAVAFIVFGVLGAGLLPTLGMSWSIVGFGPGGVNPMQGMMPGGSGGGHAIAGAIGGGLLWAVAGSLVGQVYLLGLSLVYLRVTEALDVSATEAALRGGLEEARRRGAEFGERARSAVQRDAAPSAAAAGGAAAAAGTAFAAPAPPESAPVHTVPSAYQSAPTNTGPRFDPPPAPYAPAAGQPLPPTQPSPFASGTGQSAPPLTYDNPDIELPLDDTPAPAAPPTYAAPPAWMPPPVLPPAPADAPAPLLTACPQCLSAVTDEDIFCGVCGFRLK